MSSASVQPIRIDLYDGTRMRIEWNSGERFAVPFKELRFLCPCAACVDEHTGRRTLERAAVRDDVRPREVLLVGRYAVQLKWNDGHETGIYSFDHLHDVCGAHGKRI